MTLSIFTGCGSASEEEATETAVETADVSSGDAAKAATSSDAEANALDIDLSGIDISNSQIGEVDDDGYLVITAIADLTPHSELLEFIEPALEEIGLKVELVSTAADSTTNEKTAAGEVDFNFFQHWPYLNDENQTNGYNLVDAGDIHIEPIRAYSDKYSSADEISDGDVVAIPNDVTNEYRALKILEEAGLIELDSDTESTLSATVADVTTYNKDIEIVELDSAQIIPTKDDYDFYITNTNKALEAGVTSNVLFSESATDNPFANIIATTEENADDPAIVAVVTALKSEQTKAYIEQTYEGAVLAVED